MGELSSGRNHPVLGQPFPGLGGEVFPLLRAGTDPALDWFQCPTSGVGPPGWGCDAHQEEEQTHGATTPAAKHVASPASEMWPKRSFILLKSGTLKKWNRLPRQVVDSPSLEIFKTRLDKVLCSLLWVTLLQQGVGLDDPQRCLPTPNMLWFCGKKMTIDLLESFFKSCHCYKLLGLSARKIPLVIYTLSHTEVFGISSLWEMLNSPNNHANGL